MGPALAEQVDQRLCTVQLDAAGRAPGSLLRASTPSLIVWGQQGATRANARVTYTNAGSQLAQITFSGVAPPYRLSQTGCSAPPFGGVCTVDVSLGSDGSLGGQGTQVLQATGASNGPVSMLVWGMLVPP